MKTEYSFLWWIENYSYGGYKLVSPEFTPQGLEGTSWSLCLDSICIKYCWEYNSIFVNRSANDAGPENFTLKFEISLIKADDSTLYSEECEHAFGKGSRRGFGSRLDMDELYVRKNTEFLPRDTLGVRCRMWEGEGGVQRVVRCTARTRIRTEKISFLHRVGNFSALTPDEEKTLRIPSHSKEGGVFTSTLYIRSGYEGEGFVMVGIQPSNRNYIIRKQKLSLIDVSGNITKCAEVNYRFKDNYYELINLYNSFPRQFILNKRKECLPNDELSLLCECTFVNGVEFETIEETVHDIPVMIYHHRFDNACGKNGSKSTEKLSSCPSALDDLKTLYNDQLLTDVVLKTATKSFPAHKSVLCARSSVFRAMLTNDMRERNTDCISVEDLEDETVRRLLLFLYSDQLEDLQWESAMQLYYAADKYAVERLKILCSSFIIDHLSTSNASEFLLFADTHSDAELKNAVQHFILKHEEEVFCSDEWEKFNETNPALAMETMKLKYKKRKIGK